MRFWSKPTRQDQDWSKYVSQAPTSKKRQLIQECQKYGVAIFVDDPTETTEGVYSQFRAVASETELQSRLLTKTAATRSMWANVIAVIALLVSVVALVKSFV
jgi:hypothetical protein